MAAIWRRAWRSKKASSAGRSYGDGALQPIFGSSSITTTMNLSTSAYTTTWSTSEPFRDGEEEGAMELRQHVVKTRRRMRGLVEEFCAGSDGNATAADRWLSELRVAWLLRLAELDASGQRTLVSRQLQSPAQTGIPALQFLNLYNFSRQPWVRCSPFVDAIVDLDPLNVDGASATSQKHVPCSNVMGAAEKVRALLDVRHAVSAASDQIMMAFCSSPYVQYAKVADDIGLLSAHVDKLGQAIRDTFDHIRTAVTPSLDDDDSSPGARGATQTTLLQLRSSPDIHKVTRSVVNYINIVLSNEALLPANYAGHQGDTCSLTTLTMEVVDSLEEELARVSQSFTDQSLRFIFLINNSYVIRQLLDTSWPPHLHDLTYLRFLNRLTNRIDRYIQSYLQATWTPLLKCLMTSPKTNCLKRSSSPLPEFESKFQSTYAAQKHWEVPDPELRKRLREVIINKVVTGFTEYLEDHNNITPGVTTQEVKDMLQELFEG